MEDKNKQVERLSEAFKTTSSIFTPLAQDEELLKAETAYIAAYENLLVLRGNMLKIQKDLDKYQAIYKTLLQKFIANEKK